jgi:hypothetical protein
MIPMLLKQASPNTYQEQHLDGLQNIAAKI